jgi:hypothetical protein
LHFLFLVDFKIEVILGWLFYWHLLLWGGLRDDVYTLFSFDATLENFTLEDGFLVLRCIQER